MARKGDIAAATEEVGKFKAAQKAGGSGANTNLTLDRQIAADVAKKKEEWRAEGLSDDEIARRTDAYARERKTAQVTMSGNRMDDLKAKYAKVDVSVDVMGKAEKILDRKLGAPGVAGYANRIVETTGNLLGTKSTEYNDFARYIAELKAWSTQTLLDRSGKPLSSEAAQMDRIIGGMNVLDTTKNMKSNFKHLRELYGKVKSDLEQRIKGGGGPGAAPTPAEPAAKPNWFKGLPGKHSSARPDDTAGVNVGRATFHEPVDPAADTFRERFAPFRDDPIAHELERDERRERPLPPPARGRERYGDETMIIT